MSTCISTCLLSITVRLNICEENTGLQVKQNRKECLYYRSTAPSTVIYAAVHHLHHFQKANAALHICFGIFL